MHHLRQAPGAQRGEDHHAQQAAQIRAKERGICSLLAQRGRGFALDLRKRNDRLGEAALAAQHRAHHATDAHQHDDALNEIVDGRGHVAAQQHIDARQNGHADHAIEIIHAERLRKQPAQPLVHRGGVRHQEHEYDRAGHDFEGVGAIALGEEFRHGGSVQKFRHDARAAAQHHPGEQAANQRVANANPRGAHAIGPAKLARVANEHHGRKIARAIRERGEPRANAATAQHKIANTARVLAAIYAYRCHATKKEYEKQNLDEHVSYHPSSPQHAIKGVAGGITGAIIL